MDERFNPSTVEGFVWHRIVFPILLRSLPEEFTANRLLLVLKKKQNRGRNEKEC
jgi:hypothetical protein